MRPEPVRFRPELLHESVYVAAGAVVVGDVTIGADSSVWFNAVLRGDTAPIRRVQGLARPQNANGALPEGGAPSAQQRPRAARPDAQPLARLERSQRL